MNDDYEKRSENVEKNESEEENKLSDLSESDSVKEIENPYQTSSASDGQAQPAATQTKKRSGSISRIILIIAIIIFLISAFFLVKNYFDIKKSQQSAQEIAGLVNDNADEIDDNAVGADGILEKYREAYNQNNDLVGWIKVPNTSIDHPVVQSDDNNFYLRKNFYKSYDRRGTVFMDYRDHVDNLCKNTILYGHNYLDSTMFSDLEKYEDIEFYKTSPVIEFNTIYKNYKWKIIAVFYANADEKDDNGYVFNYIYPFMSDNSFEEYLDQIMVRSLYFTGVDVRKTDKILTLSTCTRNMDIKGRGETNARLVVVARLVRDGESAEVETSVAIENSNPRYPQVWYTAHNLTNPYVDAEQWYPEGAEY